PDAEAVIFRREERIEDAFAHFGRQSWPVVSHASDDVRLVAVLDSQADEDFTANRARLNRILQEVYEQLLDSLGVEWDPRHLGKFGPDTKLLFVDLVVEVADRPHDELGERLERARGAFREGVACQLVNEQSDLFQVHLAGLEELVAEIRIVIALGDEIEKRL